MTLILLTSALDLTADDRDDKNYMDHRHSSNSAISDDDEYFGIETQEERRDFISKVYGILSVQLVATSFGKLSRIIKYSCVSCNRIEELWKLLSCKYMVLDHLYGRYNCN